MKTLHPDVTEPETNNEVGGKPAWVEALEGYLVQAAELAAAHNVPPEAFGAAAWHALLAASPALAEQLEMAQFMASVEQLRSAGRLALA